MLIGSFAATAAAPELWVVAGSFFVANFSIICLNVPGQTIRQSETPEPRMGRVVSTYEWLRLGLPQSVRYLAG